MLKSSVKVRLVSASFGSSIPTPMMEIVIEKQAEEEFSYGNEALLRQQRKPSVFALPFG